MSPWYAIIHPCWNGCPSDGAVPVLPWTGPPGTPRRAAPVPLATTSRIKVRNALAVVSSSGLGPAPASA